jgi:hypothetical protein
LNFKNLIKNQKNKNIEKNYKNIFKRIPSLNIGNLVSPNKKIYGNKNNTKTIC